MAGLGKKTGSFSTSQTFHTDTSINKSLFPTVTGGRQETIAVVSAEHDVERGIADILAKSVAEFLASDEDDSSGSMMYRGGAPVHRAPPAATTSLKKVFDGSAAVIKRNIAEAVFKHDTTIRTILEMIVCRTQKIIVMIPKGTGGRAEITPERALAQTVSTSAEAREYSMARYGIDVTMNLNMFSQPEAAATELTLKLAIQKRELEISLNALGFDACLSGGVSVIDAELRMDSVRGTKTGRARRIAAAKLHAQVAFTLNKDEDALRMLVLRLATATPHTPVGGASSGGILLVPRGTSLVKWTDPSQMEYWLSGFPNKGDRFSFPSENVRQTVNGIKVAEYDPPADYTLSDTENPQIIDDDLSREVAIATYYRLNEQVWDNAGTGRWRIGLTDFESEEWVFHTITPADIRALGALVPTGLGGNENNGYTIDANKLVTEMKKIVGDNFPFSKATYGANEEVELFLWRPAHVVQSESGFYCVKPGIETGFLGVGYPKTGVTIDQSTESLLIMGRQYQVAGLTNNQNLIILPDIKCSGNIRGHGSNLAKNPFEYTAPTTDDETIGSHGTDLVLMAKLESTPWSDFSRDPLVVALNAARPDTHGMQQGGPLSVVIQQAMDYQASGELREFDEVQHVFQDGEDAPEFRRDLEVPLLPFPGTSINREMKVVSKNTGPLQTLDMPENVCRMGASFQRRGRD